MRNPGLLAVSVAALGALLTGCIRGGTTDGPLGVASNNPPPSAAEEPTPPPPPPPPPPPEPQLPPLSPVIVDLDDNHQVGVTYWPDHDTASGGQGEPVGKYVCWPHWPPETYHVHSHLSIFLDKQALAVPDDIGVVKGATDYCYYTLHTHDRSGKLHVEAPAPEFFTLGDLFRIWGQPLGPDNVAGLTGKPIVVYVTDQNGVVTLASGDWRDIELLSHREITIQVGETIDEIPNFFWSSH